MLPKAKKKKVMSKKEFLKVAKKVRQSLRDEAEFLQKRKAMYGNNSDFSDIPNFC